MKFLLLMVAVMAPDYNAEQPEFVVKVVDTHRGYFYTSSGSLIRSDLVLTCQHAVRDRTPGSVTVVFKDGTVVKAEVLREDRGKDLAILRIKKQAREVARPAMAGPKKGDTVTVCGFPRGTQYAEVTGKITGKSGHSMLMDDMCIQGMSGSPVLNDFGRVVGVEWGAVDGETYFTPLAEIHKLLGGVTWNFLEFHLTE